MDLATRLNNFVRRHKLSRVFDALADFAPDLAVEVFALEEAVADYEEKIAEYLSWGVRLIWLVGPNTQTVVRANGERQVLRGNDVLSGEDVIAGFKIRVRKIFE